jgi:hypothetical protein
MISSLQKKKKKKRSYNPDVKKITSVHEAVLHQEFLTDAIQRIEQLKVSVSFPGHVNLSNPYLFF